MKFKGMPGLTVTDGKYSVEFPFNGVLELKGKKAKWLKGLVESGKVKGVEIVGREEEQTENAENTAEEEVDKAQSEG